MDQRRHSSTLIAIILVLIILILGIGWWFFTSRVDHTLIGEEIVVRRAMVGEIKTENGYLAIPFTRDSARFNYLNVAIDLNKDGQIAAYDIEGGRQEEWVMKNAPALVLKEEGYGFSFTLSDLSAEERSDFPLTAILTKGSLALWADEAPPGSAERATTVAAIEPDDIRPRFTPDPTGARDGGIINAAQAYNLHSDLSAPERPPESWTGLPGKELKGETGPEVEVMVRGLPDFDQGHNECVPTAAANGIRWLVDRTGTYLPISDTEIIAELKDDMSWTDDGVATDDDFVSGKDDFVDRYDLPIETHRLGEIWGPDLFDRIVEELERGQTVEIVIEYGVYDRRGRYERRGGHMMTVVGASRTVGEFLYVHDPASPGPNRVDLYPLDGNHLVNYRYRGESIAYLRSAYAESPTAPIVEEMGTAPPEDATAPAEEEVAADDEEIVWEITPEDLEFTHDIGMTECPTEIGDIMIDSDDIIEWEITSDEPDWLDLNKKRGAAGDKIKASFTCVLTSYTTQALSTDVEFVIYDDQGNASGTATVTIKGQIKE